MYQLQNLECSSSGVLLVYA